MTGLLGKIGFAHRELWSHSGPYRASLLLGPISLLGAGLAFLAWVAVSGGLSQAMSVPWAKPKNTTWAAAAPGEVSVLQPTAALPATAADGTLVGYRREWRVTTHTFRVSPTWQTDFNETPLDRPTYISGATFDMERFFTKPQHGLVAAMGAAMFVAKEGGRYTFSASFERPAGPPANCLTRVIFLGRTLTSTIEGNLIDERSRTYKGASFDLSPGLYPINFVFSCWNSRNMTQGPGRMTLLAQHPGETTLSPARIVEIVRPIAGTH
jgi:hypothetical protein